MRLPVLVDSSHSLQDRAASRHQFRASQTRRRLPLRAKSVRLVQQVSTRNLCTHAGLDVPYPAKSTAAKRAKTQAPTDETRNTFANGKAIADFPDATPNPAAAIALARVAEAIALGLIKVIDFSNSVRLTLHRASRVELISVQYCYGCQNGGASIACDECPRIICLKHVPQIEVIPETTRDKLHFRCPSCHSRATQNKRGVAPYFVSAHLGLT